MLVLESLSISRLQQYKHILILLAQKLCQLSIVPSLKDIEHFKSSILFVLLDAFLEPALFKDVDNSQSQKKERVAPDCFT